MYASSHGVSNPALHNAQATTQLPMPPHSATTSFGTQSIFMPYGDEKLRLDSDGKPSSEANFGLELGASTNGKIDGDGTMGKPAAEDAPTPPAGPTFPDGGRDAWLVVLGGFLAFYCGLGYISSYAVFQAYYAEHQLAGYSQDTIAWIGSIQLWGNFGFGLPAGILLDRFGAKAPMLIGTFFVFIGTMMTSLCQPGQFYQFFLSQGLCSSIGYGLIFNCALSVPNQWFLKKRGVVSGLVVGGTSFGGALWPVMLNSLLNDRKVDFGTTIRACGYIQGGLLLVATFLIKTRFPRNMIKGPPPFKAMFTCPKYLAFLAADTIAFFGLYSPYIFVSAYGVSRGASLSTSFFMASVLNATSFFGRFLIGLLADKMGWFNTLSASTLLTAIIAFCWPAAHSVSAQFVWAAFYGFWAGAVVSLLAPCVARIAPSPKLIGQYMGVNTTIAALGVLAAEPIAGRLIQNHHGDFTQAQIFIAVMILLGAGFFVLARLLVGRGLKV